MRLFRLLILIALGVGLTVSRHLPRAHAVSATEPFPSAGITHTLPLAFEANRGQAPHTVRYLARGPQYTALFGSQGVQLLLPSHGTSRPIMSPRVADRHRP